MFIYNKEKNPIIRKSNINENVANLQHKSGKSHLQFQTQFFLFHGNKY